MNLYQLFLHARHKYADKIAIIDPRNKLTITFSEIIGHFHQVAQFLDQQSVSAGSKVALLGDTDSQSLLLDYALMASGRVRVPLDTALSVQELLAQIHDSSAMLLAYQDNCRETALALSNQGIRCIPVRDFFRVITSDYQMPDIPPQQLLSLNYTGGSTGHPKAVMHTHASFVSAITNMILARQIEPGNKFLNVRPLWPIAAIVVLSHILAGGTVVLEQRFRADSFLSLLKYHRAGYSSLVPTQLSRLLSQLSDHPLTDLPELRCIDIGASAIPEEVLNQGLKVFSGRLALLYGMTEAPWSSYLRYATLSATVVASENGLSGLTGHPVFGAAITIDQPDQHGIGEIKIGGSHLMAGYWQNAALTAETLQDGWLRTGDLGVKTAEGYIRIVGRIKEIIRSGGKSVLPKEVELCILSYPGIAEVHVFGQPDTEWGEKICAAIVLSHPTEAFSTDPLTEYCQKHLSRFKVPKRFYILDSLPRSHYGKVKSAELQASVSGL